MNLSSCCGLGSFTAYRPLLENALLATGKGGRQRGAPVAIVVAVGGKVSVLTVVVVAER